MGIELKESYYEMAVRNLQRAESLNRDLFSLMDDSTLLEKEAE